MPLMAILIGVLLVAIGLQGHFDFGDVLGVEKGHQTALIPAYFGGALILLGLIALPGGGARKHAMHLAAMVGLVGVIGGVYRPVMALTKGTFDLNLTPTRLQLAMAALCLIFVLLCIQSFISARRVRGFGGN